MKPKGVFYRTLVASLFLGTLVVGAVVFVPTSRAEDKEYGPPKLVWERTFEKNILAAGVDEERFAQAKEDFFSSLKWILLHHNALGQLDKRGKVIMRPEEDRVFPSSMSDNARYLCAMRYEKEWWSKEKGVHYTFLDWEGRTIWQVDDKKWLPLLWDDGSGVFLLTGMDILPFRLRGVKFFDPRGRITTVHEFRNWPRSMGYFYAKSSNFLALATTGSEEEGFPTTLYVFKKAGELLWKREDIRKWYTGDHGVKKGWMFRGVSVSDAGAVTLVRRRLQPSVLEVLIYDRKGRLQNSQQLSDTGPLYASKIVGKFAFVPAGYRRQEGRLRGSRFLCYDLEETKVKFLLEGEADHRFGNFDVDAEAGLVAVAVLAKDRDDAVKIYDLNGAYKTEVKVDIVRRGPDEFWLKLLDNALLVAEGNRLKLYAIGGR